MSIQNKLQMALPFDNLGGIKQWYESSRMSWGKPFNVAAVISSADPKWVSVKSINGKVEWASESPGLTMNQAGVPNPLADDRGPFSGVIVGQVVANKFVAYFSFDNSSLPSSSSFEVSLVKLSGLGLNTPKVIDTQVPGVVDLIHKISAEQETGGISADSWVYIMPDNYSITSTLNTPACMYGSFQPRVEPVVEVVNEPAQENTQEEPVKEEPKEENITSKEVLESLRVLRNISGISGIGDPRFESLVSAGVISEFKDLYDTSIDPESVSERTSIVGSRVPVSVWAKWISQVESGEVVIPEESQLFEALMEAFDDKLPAWTEGQIKSLYPDEIIESEIIEEEPLPIEEEEDNTTEEV